MFLLHIPSRIHVLAVFIVFLFVAGLSVSSAFLAKSAFAQHHDFDFDRGDYGECRNACRCDVNIFANGSSGSISVPAGSSVTISWTSIEDDNGVLVKSGEWTGSAPASGSQIVGPLAGRAPPYIFTLGCQGFPGCANYSNSVSVFVVGAPPPPPGGLTASCPVPGTTASLDWADTPGATFYALRVNNQADPWDGSCTSPGGDFCIDKTVSNHTFTSIAGAAYTWWVHSCNISGCSAAATSGPAFTCTLPPPPPAPTVTTSLTCINPGYSGSGFTISWTNSGVTFVDIDTKDAAFLPPYYNKGALNFLTPTSASAPAGFNYQPPPGPTLTFNPSRPYHVRTFNGTRHSLPRTFITPPVCLPPWIQTTGGDVHSNEKIITPGGP